VQILRNRTNLHQSTIQYNNYTPYDVQVTALWRRYARERYATNLRKRSKRWRGSRSYYCYYLLFIMPPREPLNLRNEWLDSAGSSHR